MNGASPGHARMCLRQAATWALLGLGCVACGKAASPAAPSPATPAPAQPEATAAAPNDRAPPTLPASPPAAQPAAAGVDPKAQPPTRSPELAALIAATDLRLPPSRCQQLIALPGSDTEAAASMPIVVAAPSGLLLNGVRVGDLDCRLGDSPCAAQSPPAAARWQLPVDSLGRTGEVTVHAALLKALQRQPSASAGARVIALFADARLSAQSLLTLWNTLLAADRVPILTAEADGWAVAHWPNEPLPDVLPPPAPREGAEALPEDIEALVLELDGAPPEATALLTRRGGGILQRPCRDPTPAGGCWRTLRDAIAARPDLQEVTLDLGYGLDVGTVAAWIEALRDPCRRDAEGACIAQVPAAQALSWIARRGAQWRDSLGDPTREGTPIPADTPPPDSGKCADPLAAGAHMGGAAGERLPPESLLLGRGLPGGAPSLLRMRLQGSP